MGNDGIPGMYLVSGISFREKEADYCALNAWYTNQIPVRRNHKKLLISHVFPGFWEIKSVKSYNKRT